MMRPAYFTIKIGNASSRHHARYECYVLHLMVQSETEEGAQEEIRQAAMKARLLEPSLDPGTLCARYGECSVSEEVRTKYAALGVRLSEEVAACELASATAAFLRLGGLEAALVDAPLIRMHVERGVAPAFEEIGYGLFSE